MRDFIGIVRRSGEGLPDSAHLSLLSEGIRHLRLVEVPFDLIHVTLPILFPLVQTALFKEYILQRLEVLIGLSKQRLFDTDPLILFWGLFCLCPVVLEENGFLNPHISVSSNCS